MPLQFPKSCIRVTLYKLNQPDVDLVSIEQLKLCIKTSALQLTSKYGVSGLWCLVPVFYQNGASSRHLRI